MKRDLESILRKGDENFPKCVALQRSVIPSAPSSYSGNNRVAGHWPKKQLQRKQLGAVILGPTKQSVVPALSPFAVSPLSAAATPSLSYAQEQKPLPANLAGNTRDRHRYSGYDS